ncbi:hypothetical protein BAY59_03935 [Prauserella coralliicola]|nr:hypothetical protein BAY59_03935 [Prauserella coralliicola]
MTATASGSCSVVAVLKPVKPSIATTSTVSRHAVGRSASQVLKACLERPSTMWSSRAGPEPLRMPVRWMITVTYLSPRRVCLQACSSSIRTRLLSARTASLAVFHATPSTPATVRCWTTMPSNAQRSPRRDSLARGSAAKAVSCRNTCPQPVHR